MKPYRRLMLATLIFLAAALLNACQPQAARTAITILDGEHIYTLQTSERAPANLLAEAGITLTSDDRLLYLGQAAPRDQPLPEAKTYTLQVRRAAPLTLIQNGQQQVMQTSALTVGQALSEAGMPLYAADHLDPPAEAPIRGALTATYIPSRELAVSAGGKAVTIRSAAATVGQALAEAGMPLEGLDYSLPAESEALPADGQIRVVHVQESVLLVQKPIPYTTEFQASADLEIDRQDFLQPGEYGLAMSRVRIRYENGQEAGRKTESETIVRPPKTRVVGYGTKVVIRTTTVDGVQIEYWRAVQMFATSYSPCRSGVSQCLYGTSSGRAVQKGVVAVVRRWYVYMQGQPVYIPGYGRATIEDVGGGIPGKYWIDLGYSDNDWQEWGDWVSVYFLTPAPTNIVWVLD